MDASSLDDPKDVETAVKVDAFHRQRRMFTIGTFGDVTLAPPNYGASHAQWFAYDKVDANVGWTTRGFYDATGLYAYKGEDFRADDFLKRELLRGLEAIGAPAHLPVYVGMKPGAVGERWEPIERLGTVGELIAAKPGISVRIPMEEETLALLLKTQGSPEAAAEFVLRILSPGAGAAVLKALRKECRHQPGPALNCVQSNEFFRCALCGDTWWD